MDKRQTRVQPELWWKVYDRDHRRCIIPQLFPEATPCTDRWGNPVHIARWGTRPYDLTFAHIKRPPDYLRVTDEQHGVMACWGHHVFGEMTITRSDTLERVREHLEGLYPSGS